jgi:hypothetical protein
LVKRAGGMAQGVSPESKPQYWGKKKKRKKWSPVGGNLVMGVMPLEELMLIPWEWVRSHRPGLVAMTIVC